MKKWMRSASSFILVAVVLALAACGGNNAGNSSSNGNTEGTANNGEAAGAEKGEKFTLSLWTISDNADPMTNLALGKAIELFKQEYPNGEIKVEGKGRPEQLYDQLNIAVSGGNAPDLFWSNVGQNVSFYVKNGKVESLDKYAQQYGWYEAYPESATSYQKRFLGDFYALPGNYNAMGIWYKKDIFEKYSLSEPKTYDELLQIASTLKENGVIPMVMAGKWPALVTRLFDGILEMEAGAELHDKLLLGEAKFNSPEVVEAFRKLKEDWVDNKYFQEGYLSNEEAQTNNLWYSGKAAMWYSGSWEFGNLRNNKQDVEGYDFFPFPTGVEPYRIVAFGDGYYMSSESKYKDEAAAFLNAMSTLEAQRITLQQNPESSSARIGAIDLDKVNDTKKKIVELLQNSGSYVPTNEMGTEPRLTDVLFDVQTRVLTGEISPQEAADILDEKAAEFGWYKE
ncbi:ABC transporter substrate-binding protein [Paenibacillus sp. sgz302251]|uniref:ABC transporter substrate-binding protein n=1 Tax=Paenibacillus sp. sgz302251 TaxID=3414493 RepID=UPI003C7D6E7A